MPKRHSLSFTLFLFISDLIMTAFALRLAVLARTLLPWGKFSRSYDIPLAVNFIAVLLFMIVYVTFGTYDSRHTRTIILELQSLITSTLIAWFSLAGILFLSFRDVSRLLMVYFLGILLFLVAAHRIAIRWAFKLIGGRTFDSQRVVVVISPQRILIVKVRDERVAPISHQVNHPAVVGPRQLVRLEVGGGLMSAIKGSP